MNFDGEGLDSVPQAGVEAGLQVDSRFGFRTAVIGLVLVALEAQNRHHLLQQKDQEGEHFG